jgi:outer membrane cobalamin receptor
MKYDGRDITHISIDRMEMKPYGRPEVELNANLSVKPVTPLTLSLGYALGATRYMLVNGEEKQMSDLHDLNLKGAWNFNDLFGAYIKLNNLLFRQQELIYGYPLQGFSAMAGINLNF